MGRRMQFDRLKRREFVTLLGTAAVAGPRGLLAQPASRRYLVGGLMPFPLATLARFVDTLGQLGFVEEQNLTIDPRGFSVPYDRLAVIAGELVEAKVDAIICAGDAAIIAAQAATSSIPIVAITDDMVGAGLVRSLARPGGNTTGVSLLAGDLDGKRQEVLFDFFPEGRRMAVLADTKTNAPSRLHELEDAAQARGVTLSIYRVERDDQIGPAIEFGEGDRRGRAQCISLAPAARHPAIHHHAIQRFTPSGHLPVGGDRARGWALGLRSATFGADGAIGEATRQSSARSKPRRPAGPAANQIRACDQPEDGKAAWPRLRADDARSCRRADRVATVLYTTLLHLLRSPSGRYCCKSRFSPMTKILRAVGATFVYKM